MNYSAQTPETFTVGSLRRGFDDVCVLINRDEDVLPSEELIFAYRKRKEQLEIQRKQTFIAMGSPNRNNLNKWKGRANKCKSVR